RDALAALVGCPPELMLHTSSGEFADVRTLGEQLGMETLLAMAQILDQTLTRLRQSTHVRTLVEVAIVRLCKLDDLDALPSLVQQLSQGGEETGDTGPGTATKRQGPSAAEAAPNQTTQKKTNDGS